MGDIGDDEIKSSDIAILYLLHARRLRREVAGAPFLYEIMSRCQYLIRVSILLCALCVKLLSFARPSREPYQAPVQGGRWPAKASDAPPVSTVSR